MGRIANNNSSLTRGVKMNIVTREEIEQWFDEGVEEGATHMIVVVDEYDWEDYPVYVSKKQNVREIYNHYNGQNMQRVMEVYSLKKDKNSQLNEHRAFHFD